MKTPYPTTTQAKFSTKQVVVTCTSFRDGLRKLLAAYPDGTKGEKQ